MSFATTLPWWAIVLLVAGALLAGYGAYWRPIVPLTGRRRLVLSAMRTATAILLVGCLLRPVRPAPPPPVRGGLVPILIDVSQSMALADEAGGRRRIDAAAAVASSLTSILAADFQVQTLTFGETLEPAGAASSVGAHARRTDLAGALKAVRERYRGRPLAGVVLLTDGADTGGSDPAEGVAWGPAVFPIGVGTPDPGFDLEVSALTVGDAAVSASLVDLSVTAVSRGASAPIELRVLANGRPVDRRRVIPPAAGVPFTEVVTVSPEAGAATLYTVEIPAAAGEIVSDNNRRSVLVPPAGRRRRVLVVEGAPGFEHTFLKRALAGDPGLEVDSVVRKGANDQGQPTFFVQAAAARSASLANGFPAGREGLFAYDAVIFGNVEWDFFRSEQLTLAADFVAERGGGLLVLGARSFSPQGLAGTRLEEILPVELSDRRGGFMPGARGLADWPVTPNHVAVTSDGARHPIMRLGPDVDGSRVRWQRVPALTGSAALGGPRPGARVLAVTSGTGNVVRPLVAVQRYGRGRSMVFGGEASWRWRMLLPSDDETYATFWRQVVRWLASGAEDPVTIAPIVSAMPGDAASLDVIARDAAFRPVADAVVTMRFRLPGGEVRAVAPALADAAAGKYSAKVRLDRPGIYQVTAEARRGQTRLGTAEQWALVGGAELELADPRRHDDLLRRLAGASGGRYLTADQLADLPALLRRSAASAPAPELRDLWHNGWAFVMILGLLLGEWGVRRAWGLK